MLNIHDLTYVIAEIWHHHATSWRQVTFCNTNRHSSQRLVNRKLGQGKKTLLTAWHLLTSKACNQVELSEERDLLARAILSLHQFALTK